YPQPNGETAVVITGGVILHVGLSAPGELLDIEADRLVFWTRGNTQQLISGLRSQEGQTSRELEFYLAGNVEIRQKQNKEIRTLRAEEVFYDVGRSTAVALHADYQFKQVGVPDPVHVRAEELLQLSQTEFKILKAEVFSSKLPSDPGLKVYVT